MTLDAFQKQIWESKYQYKNETFKGFCERIGNTIFPEDEKRREELIEYIKNFEVLFGGRINANIGIEEGGLTLFNCYILSTSKYDMDSLEGILDLAKDYALTLKSEGGVGFCANFLRPSKTIIRKIGVSTPGSVKFLEVFDKISDVITSGSVDKCDSYQGIPTKSSIRKGATMVTLNVCHPDIEEFVAAKSVPNRLTKMNMSVLITDAFMYAVENDLDWDLWFPDINFEKYKAEWDGSFEKWAEKGYPFVVYKTVKARELWDLLLKNSFNRNEPGILFIDTIRRYNNLAYIKELEVNCCNPCVVKGTLVATDRGLYPVEKLKVGDTIQTTLGFNKIKDITTYENQDVYRVNFSDGFFQDVTKGHIFHTMKTGKEAKKVWVDTIRLSELGSDTFVRKGWYKAYPEIDNTLIRDDGLLIGLYLGNGGFSNYTCFNISTNSNEDNSYIEDLFTRVGGNVRIDKSEGNCNRYYLTDNNTYLIKLFDKLGIDPNGKSFDIKNLLNTNKDFILGLIDGLISSDGDVNTKGNCPQVRFTNTSDLLHELLKHLMLFVKADYKKYNNKKAGEISKIYGREVIRKKDCYTGVIDNDSILNFYNEVGFLSHNEKNELLKYVIKNYQLNGVRWKTKIKSVEFIGKAEVYDIFEETTDTWNHEGYISRGCAEVTSVTGKLNHNNKEITMGDVCDLGSVNVVKFYNVKTKKFDFDSFNKRVAIMVRALDSIIDISNYPLEQYRVSAQLRRKIGVGVTGIGSLLMMMNTRYGSEESTSFLEKLFHNFMNTLYKESALLAKEKGPFELYSNKLLEEGYVSLGFLTTETIDLIKKYGLRNSMLSAVAPTGCLVDGTLISTSKGCCEINNATHFSELTATTKLSSDFADVSFSGWYDKGFEKVIKVTTKDGYSITGTYDHKIRVISAGGGYCWKSLSELCAGDFAVLKKDFIVDKTTWVRDDLSELLGFYMADGWFNNNRLYFQVHNKEVEYIKTLITKVFSGKFSQIIVRPRQDENSSRVEINSKKIRDWFNNYGCIKEGAHNAFIPNIVLSSGRKTILKFLKGFFIGGGGFNASKQNIKFTTVSDKLAFQLQFVLLGLGILSHKHVEQTKGNTVVINDREVVSNYNANRIELSVFYSRQLCYLMGVDSTKIEVKYDGRNFNPVLITPEEVNLFNEDAFINDIKEQNILCVTEDRYKKVVSKDSYNWFVNNNMCLNRITSLENLDGEQHVQDLSIYDKSHTYLANGFITHNTLSILAGNVSGGIEPVFSKEFYRWVRIESKKVDFDYPNISKGEWFETDYLKETAIGDEVVLLSKDEQYRVDKNTGLCEKITVQDYGYKLAKEFGLTETAGAMELSIEEHLNVLRVCNKYIDLSTSKTINIPKETTFEEFKALYGKIYSYGIKGCTTYREGSSVAVLETQRKEKEKSVKVQQKEFLSAFKDQQNGDIVAHDIQLPEEYPALGYILKTEGKKFYLHVCFKDKACTKPFAIFVNTNAREDNVTTFNALEKLEEIALHKGLNPEFIEETKRKYSYQKNPVKICRMLGLLLRHNVDVYTIVKGLDELEGATIGTFVFRIKKFLSQFVSSHDVEGMTCAECGEKTIVFSEGCFLCKQCGYSKCG